MKRKNIIKQPSKILVVDDELEICIKIKKSILRDFDDSEVFTANEPRQALDILCSTNINVVVADMNMGKPESGYALLLSIKKHNPMTQVIVFTAYPDYKNAVRCVRAGCFDYVPKNKGIENLLKSIGRGLQISVITRDTDMLSERLILADWYEVLRASDSGAKGTSLESLCSLLFRSIPGWQRVECRVNTKTEEIDLVVLNESSDEFWKRFGSFILVECKNWHKRTKPGKNEFDSFYSKIMRRGKIDCRLGFFVSLYGVAKTFDTEILRIGKENVVIVTISEDNLWGLIRTPDRSKFLKNMIADQIFN